MLGLLGVGALAPIDTTSRRSSSFVIQVPSSTSPPSTSPPATSSWHSATPWTSLLDSSSCSIHVGCMIVDLLTGTFPSSSLAAPRAACSGAGLVGCTTRPLALWARRLLCLGSRCQRSCQQRLDLPVGVPGAQPTCSGPWCCRRCLCGCSHWLRGSHRQSSLWLCDLGLSRWPSRPLYHLFASFRLFPYLSSHARARDTFHFMVHGLPEFSSPC